MSEPTIVRDHTGEPVLCVICEGVFVLGQQWEDRHTMVDGPCHAPCCVECPTEDDVA